MVDHTIAQRVQQRKRMIRDISHLLAKNQAGIIINSDGTGRNVDSRSIHKKTPPYQSAQMVCTIEVINECILLKCYFIVQWLYLSF